MHFADFVVWIDQYEVDENLYPPCKTDLFSLYSHVKSHKVTQILEIGSGWSTLVLAQALLENCDELQHSDVISDPNFQGFRMISLDASEVYLKASLSRLSSQQSALVQGMVSTPRMTVLNARICHIFDSLPNFNADLIYLDGPDCDQVADSIYGISVHPKISSKAAAVPMSGDLLLLEHFIQPGSWIIVDGRGANSEFLKTHFVRDWEYNYRSELDQHFFHLVAPDWGQRNARYRMR